MARIDTEERFGVGKLEAKRQFGIEIHTPSACIKTAMARLHGDSKDAPITSRLLSLPSEELIHELKALESRLSLVEQDDASAKAANAKIAADLLAPAIVKHKDRAVRIISACCVAHILRIFAPEAPYDLARLTVFHRLHCVGLFQFIPAATSRSFRRSRTLLQLSF